MKSGDFYDFGPFRLDARKHLLLRDSQPVALTPKALETLLLLVESSGRVLEKDELMSKLWPGAFVEEANLAQNISLLRKALGESPSDHHYVVTVPGRGYRFVADVRRASEDSDELIIEKHTVSRVIVEDAQEGQELEAETQQIGEGEASGLVLDRPSAGGQSVAAVRVYPDRERRERPALPAPRGRLRTLLQSRAPSVRWVVALGGLVVGLAAVLVALNVGGLRDRLLGRPNVGPIHSLAVLPLENLSGDPNQEYFADGMTDELITELAKIGALRVISRTSSMRYKRTQKPLAEIARELNVDAVVEGTVMRSGDKVRITAQLIHAPTDRHLWAESYARDLRDVLVVEDEVAQAIARQIQIKVLPEEQARLAGARPINPEAHELYLRGRYFWNAWTEKGIRTGMDFFQQAIKQDPSYALAYVGLADSYISLGSFGVGVLPPEEAMPRAEAAAQKAVDLDPTLGGGHASLAMTEFLYRWDWAGAEKEFNRAVELSPNYATAYHWYSHFLMSMGRTGESLLASERAYNLDPLDVEMGVHLMWHYFNARDYDSVLAQGQKNLEISPNFAETYLFIGQAYEQKGMYPQALAELQKGVRLSGGRTLLVSSLGHAYGVSGNYPATRKVVEDLKELSSRRYVSSYDIAMVYVGANDKVHAFDWLEQAYTRHDPELTGLKVDARLDSLRSDPLFRDLLKRIGLPP